MSSHPMNLMLRFLLEIAALIAMGYWGWHQAEGGFRFVFVIGLPLLWMLLWGVFNVPNDPSRSGKAPIQVPGVVRFILELTLFGLAVWTLYKVELVWLSWAMGILLVLHYALSFDRIRWLMRA